MTTITVRLDDETDTRLKQRLARTGETLSQFVREAVRERLVTHPIETRIEALERALKGIDDDGETDVSTTYKVRIREKLLARHNR